MGVNDVKPEAADILRRARERIATPERWTQGTFGRFYADTGEIICECVNGALLSAAKAFGDVALMQSGASLVLSMTARARGFETASRFNDAPGRTHAEILAFMDEAIALAESLAGPAS